MTRMMRHALVLLPIASVCSTLCAQPGASCLDQRFRPDFEPRDLEFGSDVAISDEHLLIVDRFSEALIYTYRRDGSGEWVLRHTVSGGSGADVVLNGDRFITGDLSVDPDGGALIYEFDGDRWNQVAELPIGPGLSTPWGEHIAFTDGHAAIGNAGEDVVIFRDTGEDEWEFVEEIMSPDSPDRRSDFGDALAMDERFLFVGAPGEDIAGGQNGAIYVYEWGANGRPVLMQKLVPEPDDVGPRLGTALALQGDTLVAGARSLDTPEFDNLGCAFVYELVDGQWALQQRLLPDPPGRRIQGGWDVSLDGNVIAMGATSQFIEGASGIGTAHVFRKSAAGSWVHAAVIAPGVSAVSYAQSVNLGGGQLAVGASDSFFAGFEHGLAEVYDLDCLLCPPDLDADGALTIYDFLTYLNLFQDGDAQADFDGDGELTIFDFLAFQDAFQAGCE
ncbi:MAG: GC-type dockerin domain-anchored protein [Phycisphaerales bacterium]